MAFDRNDPADLLALKNEVNNDPLGMGYFSSGNTQILLDLLNSPEGNLAPDNGNDFILAGRLLDAIFEVPVSAQDQFKIQLLFEVAQGKNDDLSDFKARIAALSGALSTALDTIMRTLSRAEVLFADIDSNGTTESVVISKPDWIAARDSQ